MYRIIPYKAEDREIELPASKSITHRLLILAAMNDGFTRISNALVSEDTKITRTALEKMGAVIKGNEDTLTVSQPIGHVLESDIYLGNSGSSARFSGQ